MTDTRGNGTNLAQTLPEQVRRWMDQNDVEAAKVREAASVADIARMAGVPEWKVFKVVAAELEDRVRRSNPCADGSRKETLVSIICESITYACHLTREDTWRRVWPRRSMAYLKSYLGNYVKEASPPPMRADGRVGG